MKPDIAIPITGDLRLTIEGHLSELFQQLLRKPGYPGNPWALERALAKVAVGDYPEWPEGLEVVEIDPLPQECFGIIARLQGSALHLPERNPRLYNAHSGAVRHVWETIRGAGLEFARYEDLEWMTRGGTVMPTIVNSKNQWSPWALATISHLTSRVTWINTEVITGTLTFGNANGQPWMDQLDSIWWLCTRRTTTE